MCVIILEVQQMDLMAAVVPESYNQAASSVKNIVRMRLLVK